MKELVINDGSVLYVLKNERGEQFARLSFNPVDTGLIERYNKVQKVMSEYEFMTDSDDFETEIVKLDQMVKEQFNTLFGKNVEQDLFSLYNPCAVFGDGDFYCEVLFNQIGIIIEKESGALVDKKIAKIKKASANKVQ